MASKSNIEWTKHTWTGKLAQAPESVLLAPLKRKKPTTYFVNSMGDLFHEDCPDEWIDKVFAVMALSPQHTFQILSKRAARMRDYCTDMMTPTRLVAAALKLPRGEVFNATWPLPNCWLGVSTERQQEADERIPLLLQTPAAVRFISAEPLLGPLDIQRWLTPARGCANCGDGQQDGKCCDEPMIVDDNAVDWVIVGGESGPKARPMHPAWARHLRDQCEAADVAFFFKQWGEFAPREIAMQIYGPEYDADDQVMSARVGKKAAGRHLDGVLHDAMPQVGG